MSDKKYRIMKSVKILSLLLVCLVFSLGVSAQKAVTLQSLSRIDVLNVGTIAYPNQSIEERSDIPFKSLVDEEFRKLLGDTVDYEKFRPTLIFFEKGFELPESTDKKISFGYISVSALSGKYRFPENMSVSQKTAIEDNLKKETEANISGTGFTIKKWNPFEFTVINGLTAIQYSYEQTLKGKSQTNIINTCIYDNDLQIQIVLSAPKKEYKKWLSYYNNMVNTFKRKVNVGDLITFEYPTNITDRKDIPFKYLVDKEFRNVLGDSIDYEAFRPKLLFMDSRFSIKDSLNIPPFGSITVNVLPDYGGKAYHKDSMKLDVLESNIKKSVEENLESTSYKINKWNAFSLSDISDLPVLKYSYEQQSEGNEPLTVYSTCIFDKGGQIQFGLSSPNSELDNWKNIYDSMLSSIHRLISIPDVGTIFYPYSIEQRDDIPFAMLVDKESKRKLGDSIDYEKFRPNMIFLKKGFNKADSLELASFNSITINTIQNDFSRVNNPDSLSSNLIETEMKASVTRSLQNTGYSIEKWNSFDVVKERGCRKVSYSYVQKMEGLEPKYICVTYIYTDNSQTQITLTCKESEYGVWEHEYDSLIDSFRPLGWR